MEVLEFSGLKRMDLALVRQCYSNRCTYQHHRSTRFELATSGN